MAYVPAFIGGRALASRIAWQDIAASSEAFDAENRIIIATGPLTGTLAPTSGRTVMCSLSPRTYPKAWYTHSTIGGWFGPELKYAGFDAIVITGKANNPVYIDIHDENVRLMDAIELWGMDARQAQLEFKQRLGGETQVLVIGPAGENLVRFATVQHSEENAAGHSGFGAVWGSKKLKAITVRGKRGITIAQPDVLLREVINFGTGRKSPSAAVLFEDESGSRSDDFSAMASVQRRPVCSQACTFRCRVNTYQETRDGRLIPAVCIGNMWRLSNTLKSATGKLPMQKLEYVACGLRIPPATNFSSADEVRLHELCNNLGLDLWFRLIMMPWFVRCRELGIYKIRGNFIDPWDVSWFEKFMYDLARREGLGSIFAESLRRAMDELDNELPKELLDLGKELEFNFGFPGHREGRIWDSEPLPFWVIAAMMLIGESRDPTIGTHQSFLLHAEFFLDNKELSRRQFRLLSNKVWGYADAFEPTFENKAPVALWCQNQHMLLDSLPLCDFAFPQLVRSMANRAEWESSENIEGDIDLGRRLYTAVTGMEISQSELMLAAERAFNIERILIARAGRNRDMEKILSEHFKLPCASDGTLVTEDGFSKLMDEYYYARGWDLKLGWPLPETLIKLGLEELLPELERLRKSI